MDLLLSMLSGTILLSFYAFSSQRNDVGRSLRTGFEARVPKIPFTAFRILLLSGAVVNLMLSFWLAFRIAIKM
jgi:hypothetical protein